MVLKDIGECLTRRVTKNLKQALHRAILVLRLGHKPLGCLEHIFNYWCTSAAAAATTTSAQQLQQIYIRLLAAAGCWHWPGNDMGNDMTMAWQGMAITWQWHGYNMAITMQWHGDDIAIYLKYCGTPYYIQCLTTWSFLVCHSRTNSQRVRCSICDTPFKHTLKYLSVACLSCPP